MLFTSFNYRSSAMSNEREEESRSRKTNNQQQTSYGCPLYTGMACADIMPICHWSFDFHVPENGEKESVELLDSLSLPGN